ncbi:MAG: FAD-dependent oxidoreductase [Lacrimispora sphenoides]
MGEKLIVIGGTAAGLSAASKARRLNPELDIKVFEKSGYVSYGACGLPYFVGGLIDEPEDLIAISANDLTIKRNISAFTHHEVTKIDREKKSVSVMNLNTRETRNFMYDKLVIATGAVPIKPSIPGVHSVGVYYLRTVEDGIMLKERALTSGQIAAIIGGGFIGLEMAEELMRRGMSVHLYEMMDRLLPFLDVNFSNIVKETLERNGIKVHLNTKVDEFQTENGHVKAVMTSKGEKQDVDFVLLSIGVKPATDLAKAAELELGIKDAIVVDDGMQTNDLSIWACGDCVQMKHLVTGRPTYVPLGTTANKQGKVAGENLTGGKEIFPGVLGSMVTKVFDLTIAATGLSAEQAKQAGLNPAISIITKADKASYYPGGKDNKICLILDKSTGRLLGAQGIGSESVAGRINVFAAAITCGMTVTQISELDLVYAPPVAPVYDPVLIAASQAIKMVERQ